jgi:DNA segregation ATPase FtsK/SpoIIIE-like protein
MAEGHSRNTNRLGVSQEALDEIQGILLLFLALAFFLSLFSVSTHRPTNLIGPVGRYLADFLIFVLGQAVAYVVPGTLVIWGVTRFRGIVWSHALFKILGLLLMVTAGCGLLAQMGYDISRFVPSQDERDFVSFKWGGAVGGFLVSPGGPNLPHHLGGAGTYLTFSTLLAVGILLATNFLFYSFFKALWVRVRHGQEAVSRRLHRWTEGWRPSDGTPSVLRFRRGRSSRVFGGAPDLDGSVAPPPEPHELPLLAMEPRVVQEAPEAGEVEDDEETEGEEDDAETALARPTEQPDLFASYQIPPLDLLSEPPPPTEALTAEDIALLSRTIEEKLASFDIEVRVTHVTQGPVVTLFELQPAPGVKISRIVTVENDLAMALRASRVRILAPIPGRGTVGIEIPNRKASIVRLREILESPQFQGQSAPLLFGLGKTIDGRPYVCNLAKMPHLLIAGATGSGKSVCLNSIICSFLLANPPDRLRFIMIDPKRVELSIYQGIPHLLAPVVNESRKSAAALAWVVTQMEERYHQLAELGVRNVDGYNAVALDPERALARCGREVGYMPHIVIIVDELADLMFIARNEVEENIIRLAQMSRAVGIHLIVATQRPSVNVITGIIKANFPCRIAFQVSSKVDSRTILDMNGAEALLGQGDMLFSGGGSMRPIRLQGAYVSDAEVERLIEFITEQGQAMTEEQMEAERAIASVRAQVVEAGADVETDEPEDEGADEPGDEEPPASIDDAERVLASERDRPPVRVQYAVEDFTAPAEGEGELTDELYERALRLILESKKASVSLIQRRMKIGYARAGRLMDLMEDRGIVGPYQGSKPRQLLVDPLEYLRKIDAAGGKKAREQR